MTINPALVVHQTYQILPLGNVWNMLHGVLGVASYLLMERGVLKLVILENIFLKKKATSSVEI